DGCGIGCYRTAVRLVENIILHGDTGDGIPEHDVSSLAVRRVGKSKCIIGDQPIRSTVDLYREAALHVIEKIVDNRQVRRRGVDPVVEVHLAYAAGSANVVKDIAV